MRYSIVITFIGLFSLIAPASAADAITGTYSTLRYVAEGGDVVGTEITIVSAGRHGYFAIIQCAEGAPSKPVVVAAMVSGTHVEIAANSDVDCDCPKSEFIGEVTPKGLIGTFGNTKYPGVLPRRASYWQ
jgi:hypothetical protein